MEASSGASDNGNEAQPPMSRTCPDFDKRAKEFMKNVCQAVDESNAIHKVVLEKTTVLLRLYAKKKAVYKKFIKFYRLLINGYISMSENVGFHHKFKEIEEQAEFLRRILNEYEDKLSRAVEIIQNCSTDIASRNESLKQSLEMACQVLKSEDLRLQVQLPNLEWIERIPEPDIEILALEWEAMQLNVGISHCLRILQMILL